MVVLDESTVIAQGPRRSRPDGRRRSRRGPPSTRTAQSKIASPANIPMRNGPRISSSSNRSSAPATEPRLFDKDALRRRQVAAGYTVEDLELILHPHGRGRQRGVGSMGDDTPLAVLSDHYRPLSHYFRQNFSQVTNPPINSLREERVMSLKTRFRNLGNVLAQDEAQTETSSCWKARPSRPACIQRMKEHLEGRFYEIDCVFPVRERRAAGERAARRGRTHPRRSRRRGARRLQPSYPDRRAHLRRPRRHADDHCHGGRAQPSRAPGSAHLHVDQCACRPNASIRIISPC